MPSRLSSAGLKRVLPLLRILPRALQHERELSSFELELILLGAGLIDDVEIVNAIPEISRRLWLLFAAQEHRNQTVSFLEYVGMTPAEARILADEVVSYSLPVEQGDSTGERPDILLQPLDQTDASISAVEVYVEPSEDPRAAGLRLMQSVMGASPGSIIVLGAGTYLLPQRLDVPDTLSFRGSGSSVSRLICADEGFVLRFAGTGSFDLSDLSFAHVGSQWGNTVQIEHATIRFERCQFCGAVFDESTGSGGHGLVLAGKVRGVVRECVAQGNHSHGIVVKDDAQVLLEANTCAENQAVGLAFFDSAAGEAIRNNCNTNGVDGISVTDQATPRLEHNTCRRNQENGLSFAGNAEGSAHKNLCQENAKDGIRIFDQAAPTLEGNRCELNGWCGIGYEGSSGGRAISNSCSSNQENGIELDDSAHPDLIDNRCSRNTESGIAFFGDSGGQAYGNQCLENAGHGIVVGEDAEPQLEANVCDLNAGSGIRFEDNSRGVVRGNRCSGNLAGSFTVADYASPDVEDNSWTS